MQHAPLSQPTYMCVHCLHRVAERLEWWTLYLLCAGDNGVVSKEKIRAQYDGSLWYLLAEENERRRADIKVATNGHAHTVKFAKQT